jgi:hypothetical protein
MVKKITVFAGIAVVMAGALVYVLGIYPPASGRDVQGAIGQRQVYREGQAADVAVTPGSAPVAAKTLTAAETKRINEIASKLAARFASDLAADLTPRVAEKLASEMATLQMTTAVREKMASELAASFSTELASEMVHSLARELAADFSQSSMSSEMNSKLSSGMATGIVAQLASDPVRRPDVRAVSERVFQPDVVGGRQPTDDEPGQHDGLTDGEQHVLVPRESNVAADGQQHLVKDGQ